MFLRTVQYPYYRHAYQALWVIERTYHIFRVFTIPEVITLAIEDFHLQLGI